MRYRNFISEVVLLLSKNEKEKAREILHTNSSDSEFQSSDEYAFASKLLMLFDMQDREGLQQVQKGSNSWMLLHSSVVKVGKRLSISDCDPGGPKGVDREDVEEIE